MLAERKFEVINSATSAVVASGPMTRFLELCGVALKAMEQPDPLLMPIEGPNPAGSDLRYTPIWDRIREARRQDDPSLSQGQWSRETKFADFKFVLDATSKALTSQSKDLHLAAWYTEAALQLDRFAGLTRGLTLVSALIERYWDSLYPLDEDGDLEIRASVIEWLDRNLDERVRALPLTDKGYTFIDYTVSRQVGYESEATSESRRRIRHDAILEKKPTAEDWDQDVYATRYERFEEDVRDLGRSLEALERLRELCFEHFTVDYAPDLPKLRNALSEVSRLSERCLSIKAQSMEGSLTVEDEVLQGATSVVAEALAPPVASAEGPRPVGEASFVLSSPSDAKAQIAAAAAYLRREDPFNPFPYTAVRALRWGELRAAGHPLDPALLVAPPSEVRIKIKRLVAEQNWTAVLDACESAMAEEYGRAWLDLQRQAARACEALGTAYAQIRARIIGELRELLTEFPQLLTETLSDDTATATPDTQGWIRGEVLAGGMPAPALASEAALDRADLLSRANEHAAKGEFDAGIRLLTNDVARQFSTRERFFAKMLLAEYCLSAGYFAMARSILLELSEQVDRFQLDQWERPADVARVFGLLYNALDRTGCSNDVRDKVYSRVCQLDPSRAVPR